MTKLVVEKTGLMKIDFRELSPGQAHYKRLKEKKKGMSEKSRKGQMDIRSKFAMILDPRIKRCKKHLLTNILLLCLSIPFNLPGRGQKPLEIETGSTGCWM